VPFLQAGTGVSPVGFIAAMAVSSTIVDVSPFSTNGALVLANAPESVDRNRFFRRLVAYGALVTLLARWCSGWCSWWSWARAGLRPRGAGPAEGAMAAAATGGTGRPAVPAPPS
jgi:hypothetical protein